MAPPSLTVNHASATSITVAPSTAALTAGQSQAYTATAHDPYGNTWSVTSSVTWRIDQIGDGGSWVQSTGTYTSSKSGTWTVRATSGAISGTSSLTVNPDVALTLTVSGFTTPTTAGISHTFTVTAQDPYGNTATSYIGTVQFTSTDSQAVLPPNYAFTAGDSGTKTFSGVILKTVGTQSITATDTITSSITGSQSGITVIPASLDHITISPSSAIVIAGSTQAFTAEAFDALGNNLGDVTASTTWSINAGAGGSFLGATYTSEFTGNWAVTGMYGSVNGTASLTINHASATSVSISPPSATLTVGQSQDYTATASDSYGNIWDSTAEVSAASGWSISVGAGGQWNGATYTSGNAGNWIITANLGAGFGTSSLQVNMT